MRVNGFSNKKNRAFFGRFKPVNRKPVETVKKKKRGYPVDRFKPAEPEVLFIYCTTTAAVHMCTRYEYVHIKQQCLHQSIMMQPNAWLTLFCYHDIKKNITRDQHVPVVGKYYPCYTSYMVQCRVQTCGGIQ